MVAFAEVSSFVRFWVKSTGDSALPELLVRLGSATAKSCVDTGDEAGDRGLAGRVERAMAGLSGHGQAGAPAGVTWGATFRTRPKFAGGSPWANCLRGRAHPEAAQKVLGPAQKLAPFDPLLRHRLATALYALGQQGRGRKADFPPRRRAFRVWALDGPTRPMAPGEQGRGQGPRRVSGRLLAVPARSRKSRARGNARPSSRPRPRRGPSARAPEQCCKIDRSFGRAVRFCVDRVRVTHRQMSVASFAAVQILTCPAEDSVSRAVGRFCDDAQCPPAFRARSWGFTSAPTASISTSARHNAGAYESFDKFFTRQLKPGQRTICPNERRDRQPGRRAHRSDRADRSRGDAPRQAASLQSGRAHRRRSRRQALRRRTVRGRLPFPARLPPRALAGRRLHHARPIDARRSLPGQLDRRAARALALFRRIGASRSSSIPRPSGA